MREFRLGRTRHVSRLHLRRTPITWWLIARNKCSNYAGAGERNPTGRPPLQLRLLQSLDLARRDHASELDRQRLHLAAIDHSLQLGPTHAEPYSSLADHKYSDPRTGLNRPRRWRRC